MVWATLSFTNISSVTICKYCLYSSKTSDEKGQLFNRLLADRHLSVHKVISSDGTLVIPAVGKLAKKPGQKHRPKTVAARAKPGF